MQLPSLARAATASTTARVTITIEPFAEIKFPDGFDFYIWVPDKKNEGIHPVLIPFKIRGNAKASITVKPDAFLKVKNGPYLGKAVRHSSGHSNHDDWDYWDHHWVDWGFHDWDDHDGHGHSGYDNNDRYGRNGHDNDCDDDWHGNNNNKNKNNGSSHGNSYGNGHDSHGNGNGYGHDDCRDDHHGSSGSGPTNLGYNVIVRFPVSSLSQVSIPNWSGYGTGLHTSTYASLPGLNNVGTPILTANVANKPHGVFGIIYVVSKRNWTTDGKDAQPGKYRGSLEVTVTADD